MSVAETLAVARGLAFLALLPVAALLALLLYRKVKALVGSLKRLAASVQGMSSTVSSGFVKPAAGASAASEAAAAGRSIFGWIRRRRGSRQTEGPTDS